MGPVNNSLATDVIRSWHRAMIWVSVVLVAITFASYAWAHHGVLSRLLFWFGLGGENNFGAWWSGMLLLISAMQAYDGFGDPDNLPGARRGWLVMSAILLALSFDEVASLHEFLSADKSYLLVFGVTGALLLAYSVSQLALSNVPWRILTLILLSFTLFGSVGLQEMYQASRTWNDPVTYGVRALIEEGTEIAGMLILIFATRANTRVLLNKHHPDALIAATRGKLPLIVAVGALVPIMAGATFILPYPGGPADWLAAGTYLLCAARVLHPILIGTEVLRQRTVLLLGFYLIASALSNGLKLSWTPEIFGGPISIRGLGNAGLLLTANVVFRMGGRRTTIWFYPTAVAVLAASFWSTSQLLWCTIPGCLALWMFALEGQSAPATSVRLREFDLELTRRLARLPLA